MRYLYGEDTVINYPIVQAEDNDYYLHRNYDRTYNVSGSIFVEAENRPGFLDCDTILYGHHMNDGSMFAGIDNWGKQAYYEAHPVLWLTKNRQEKASATLLSSGACLYNRLSDIQKGISREFDKRRSRT